MGERVLIVDDLLATGGTAAATVSLVRQLGGEIVGLDFMDKVYEEDRAFVAALEEKSDASVTYAELPGAQHAFDVFASKRTQAVVYGIERFLNVIRAETQHGQPAVAQSSSNT